MAGIIRRCEVDRGQQQDPAEVSAIGSKGWTADIVFDKTGPRAEGGWRRSSMSILNRLFGKADQSAKAQVPTGGATRILVCALAPKFGEVLTADAERYAQFYPATTMMTFSTADEFVGALKDRFDVVHLFCDTDQNGRISGTHLDGTALIRTCCSSGVKLLWIASDNSASGYINGFSPKGQKINLVMTLQRRGTNFGTFLQSLLAKMSAGTSMPVAWAELCPQIPNLTHNDAPETIFSAGYGQLRLR